MNFSKEAVAMFIAAIGILSVIGKEYIKPQKYRTGLLVMDRVPEIGFSGSRNQPKNGFLRQVEQSLS